MTYFNFLIFFVLVPIAILLVITWLDLRAGRPTPGFDAKKVPLIIAVHVLIALLYTTPWDNYLVATGVWYYNPDLVTGITIGYVPIEEYTFFVVETFLVGLWWWFLARRIRWSSSHRWSSSRVAAYRDQAYRDQSYPDRTFRPNRPLVYLSTSILIAAWLFFTLQFFFAGDEWNYLGIIFFWALPPIIPQLLFGADILWHYRKLVFWAIFVPGLYLSLTDIVALTATTWQISKEQTLGINFFGILPVEEVAFFFITCTLIGFGMTLMLSNLGWERFQTWRVRGFKGLP
jgi:lycopene cyclase domain-containing protein